MPPPRSRGHSASEVAVVGLICSVVLAALATFVGVSSDRSAVDVDQAVYEQTLQSMHQGQNYYQAMRAALVGKEGAPPSQVRSIRMPTEFWILAPLPLEVIRWLMFVPFVAIVRCVYELAARRHIWLGVLAASVASLWLIGASPHLYLHAELWGLAFAAGGVLALVRKQFALAACALLIAVLFRELYLVLLLTATAFAPVRRYLAVAVLLAIASLSVHAWRAQSVLVEQGREQALNGTNGWHQTLSAISPSPHTGGWIVGSLTTVLALYALARAVRSDFVARVMLFYALVMLSLTFTFGRTYWGLCFGPLLVAFAFRVELPKREVVPSAT